jgi:hypothetical protein
MLGCTSQQLRAYGAQQCLNSQASKAQSYTDCMAKNKLYYDEYDKTQKQEPLTLKGALIDNDPLCYKNPRAGEKACETTDTTRK